MTGSTTQGIRTVLHPVSDLSAAKAVYDGVTPLQAGDIADVVTWVASRPPHVVIADVLVYPVDQAGSGRLARRTQ